VELQLDATELAEALRVVVREEIQLLRTEVREQEWFSRTAAAIYLDTSPAALRSAVSASRLVEHRSATGRPRYRRGDLDAFAVAGDAE
jgi:hypothetical protein